MGVAGLTVRRATRDDLPTIVHLLADDPLGAEREADVVPLPDSYHVAFDAIEADANRVAADRRSGGIGRRLIRWCIERARQRGCRMVQLTSNKSRADAIRFYESLGFVASHEGFKLHLRPHGSE